jgi:signal transduction histidine kinase/CheY-like chemotaxis protein
VKLPGSLSSKFALTVSDFIVLTSVTLGSFVISHDIELISRGLVYRGTSLVRNLAYHLEYELQFAADQRLAELIEGVVKQEDVLYVIVQGPDGVIRAAGKAAQLAEIPPLELPGGVRRELAPGDKTKIFRFRWGSEEIHEIVHRVTTTRRRAEEIGLTVGGEEQTLGWARVGISLALQPINEAVSNVKRTITLVTCLVIAAGILAAVLVAKFMMRPLRELAQGAQRIEKGELDLKVPAGSRDEIGDLAVSFNHMAQALRARGEDNRQLVRALEETNRSLAMASQHKSQFLANMSHELRTPLNAIIGFSEILLNEAESALPSDVRREFQGHILDSGRHLLRLINDILDLSKIEAGRMALGPERVDVSDTVEGVLDTVRPLASKKRIDVTTEVDEATATIDADPAKLKQILYNLLSNAIKFTPEDGHVGVRVSRQPRDVQFAVWDTGIGIPREELGRIFDEFYQIQQTAGKEYPGTGLGLPLAQKFVELHGGRIWVESEPGRGSTFTFTIPSAPKTEERRDAAVAPVHGTGPLVLVVEDDERTRELLRFSLNRSGYRVEEARDGEEALAKARNLRPAIITLDILLPRRDGWDVLRALKEDVTTRDIPVVIVSIVDEQQRGYSLGAADYILKPFSRDDLLQRLASFGLTAAIRAHAVKALVVVEDPELMDTVAGMLEGAEFHTLRSQGPRDALALAIDARPDVIVLNLVMHEMSGFEVMRQLRANRWTKEIPVFIVTARSLDEADKLALHGLAIEIIEQGAFSTEDLLEQIRWLMRLRSLWGVTPDGR